MVLFFQAVVSGLTIGAIYALVAMGYNVVYASTQVFNLAQGMLVMVGVMMMYEFREVMGWPTVLAAIGAIVVAGLINVAIERVCVAPLSRTRGGAEHNIALPAFVTTLGASLVILDSFELIFGSEILPFHQYFAAKAFTIGGVHISRQQLFMVVAALVIALGYSAFAKYTRWGLGLSAMAQNREGASLRGVPVSGARIVAFLLAGMISGFAGVAIAPVTFADTTLGFNYALKGFVAMAIGGFGSTTGALVGGAVLGLSEAMLTTYGNDQYRIYASLALLIVVFTLRPRGILGRQTIRTV
ncbi:MAG TPA: branched-chain amino acid ABC transporter permease [Acidimicrobiales bacterium]|nr:branched-chain amino acid ABC transporter permease [Acidimicrobiales bacterium]